MAVESSVLEAALTPMPQEHNPIDAIRDLVRGIISSDDSGRVPEISTEACWHAVVAPLCLHRLVSATASMLERRDVLSQVPAPIRDGIERDLRWTRVRNQLRMTLLGRVLESLRAGGVDPIVLKGVALANALYPDLGARPMIDLDLLVTPEEIPAVVRTVTPLNFTERSRTEDAFQFIDRSGTVLDVHHRFRIYETHDLAALATPLVPRHAAMPAFRILEPTAMLAHLIQHLQGHLRGTGCFLAWIVDIGLVVHTWGDRIDPDRLRALLPNRSAQRLLGRLAGFLQEDLGLDLPTSLAGFADLRHPFTLAEMLRSRRLAVWDLPYPRGWLRLTACGLRLRPRRSRPWPQASDTLLWIADAWRQSRSAV